tara:strand:- start:410 stop:658 length:249 start_codon:yes stop_codon:yes gene_type:complete
MKRYTRKQRGGNFKCPTIAGESAQNNMVACKMASLSNETANLNAETQMGGRKKRYKKTRSKKKNRKKTKRKKYKSLRRKNKK